MCAAVLCDWQARAGAGCSQGNSRQLTRRRECSCAAPAVPGGIGQGGCDAFGGPGSLCGNAAGRWAISQVNHLITAEAPAGQCSAESSMCRWCISRRTRLGSCEFAHSPCACNIAHLSVRSDLLLQCADGVYSSLGCNAHSVYMGLQRCSGGDEALCSSQPASV